MQQKKKKIAREMRRGSEHRKAQKRATVEMERVLKSE